jgi:hypothetical protein
MKNKVNPFLSLQRQQGLRKQPIRITSNTLFY